MEEYIIPKPVPAALEPTTYTAPNFAKPVWIDPQMNCDQCQYNGQDIDTFPCAKCHTRT